MNGLDVRVAALAAAVQAVLGALVLLDVVSLTNEQLAGVMTAVNAVLAALVIWVSPYIPVIGNKGP